MGGMSLMHWLIVILILLIFFGPNRLPELGKGLGQAIRGFKKGLSEDEAPSAAEPKARIAQQQNVKSEQTETAKVEEPS